MNAVRPSFLRQAMSAMAVAFSAAGCGSGGTGEAAGEATGAATRNAAVAVGQPFTYERVERNALRTFNFDGDQPFVDPQTGQSNFASFSFNGTGLDTDAITNAGSGTPHISKTVDTAAGYRLTTVQLLASDQGPDGFRTQLNSFHFEPYKTYLVDLEFKLDASWDFSMSPGAGLLWQIKGDPKPGQWGNPVLALNLYQRELRLSPQYPASALNATSWPVRVQWNEGDYAAAPVARRQLQADTYYHVSILFFADDRPAAFGGQGYVTAWIDGEEWLRYQGPTLHPDQNGWHRTDFGWYQWEGKPSADRRIHFKTSRLYEWR